ncbi:hypothetical protein MMC21_008292 [Puttea exsequens]|nr:hypothetical protein [Puttea exsequens]
MDPRKISLQAAITATPLSSHRYEIDIHPDVCFGKSVHGGFLASIITQTAQQHFSITLKDRGHPHPFDLHIIFFSSATAGKAQLEVEDSSLGSGFSTIHVTLLQGGRKRTAAYVSWVTFCANKWSLTKDMWS